MDAAAAAAAAAAALLGLTLALRSRGGFATILLLVAFLLLGLLLGTMRIESLAESRLEQQLGKWITAEVEVRKPPKVSNGRMSMIAGAKGGRRRQKQLVLDEEVLVRISCGKQCDKLEALSISEGQKLRLQGTVGKIESRPERDFDYGLYLLRRGVNVSLDSDISRVELLHEARGGFKGFIDEMRLHARSSLGTGEWGDASGLFQGMVIGDTRGIGDKVINDFRDSGLLHLLAVSGQNVVLLGFVVSAFCQALRVPRRTATLAAAAIILIYVPLTGADASIMRAGAVGLLGLTAELLSRQADRYHFLALAAAAILTLNPNSIFDPGFQLSFAAVLSIFLVAPALTARLDFLPGFIREPVCISAAAGLVTAPITLFHFHQVPLMTVPANVAAAPISGPVMLLGVATIAIEPLNTTLNWVINGAACICTGYLVVVSRTFASVPGCVYQGQAPGIIAMAAFYGLLAVMAFLLRKPLSAVHMLRRAWRRPSAVVAIIILAVLSGLYLSRDGAAGTPPAVLTVSFLDVGQGDATLLQDPRGATILIDGGPGSQVLKALKKSGVERLDAVILTHPHSDHYAGLDDVLDSYDVAAFYDSGVSQAEAEGESPAGGRDYERMMKLLAEKGIAPQTLRRGQRLDFAGLELSVYHPGSWLRPDDANANSVVIVASYGGLDILLPGDAEGEVLTTLDLPRVEVYKAPHHGSRDLYLGSVLADLEPDCAVISVGEGNDYGHPSQSTLDAIARAETQIYRTDSQGTVRITAAGGCEGATTER